MPPPVGRPQNSIFRGRGARWTPQTASQPRPDAPRRDGDAGCIGGEPSSVLQHDRQEDEAPWSTNPTIVISIAGREGALREMWRSTTGFFAGEFADDQPDEGAAATTAGGRSSRREPVVLLALSRRSERLDADTEERRGRVVDRDVAIAEVRWVEDDMLATTSARRRPAGRCRDHRQLYCRSAHPPSTGPMIGATTMPSAQNATACPRSSAAETSSGRMAWDNGWITPPSCLMMRQDDVKGRARAPARRGTDATVKPVHRHHQQGYA